MSKPTHCAKWVSVDPAKYGTKVPRLVCTLRKHHSDRYHLNHASGWMWNYIWWANPVRPGAIVREWKCRGWVEELRGQCGRTFVGTEDEARVKGWKIQLGGFRDQLCPQCGKPDPVTAALARDLERSIR